MRLEQLLKIPTHNEIQQNNWNGNAFLAYSFLQSIIKILYYLYDVYLL